MWNIPSLPSIENASLNYIPGTTQDPSMLIIPLDLCNKTKYRSGTFSHFAPGLEQATLPSTDLYR